MTFAKYPDLGAQGPPGPPGGGSARGFQLFTSLSPGGGAIALSNPITPTHIVLDENAINIGFSALGPIVLRVEDIPLSITVQGNAGGTLNVRIDSFALGLINYTVIANLLGVGEQAILRVGAYQDGAGVGGGGILTAQFATVVDTAPIDIETIGPTAATYPNVGFRWPVRAGTLRNFKILCTANALSPLDSLTWQVLVNGLPSGLFVTVPGGVTGTFDAPGIAVVANDDLVSFREFITPGAPPSGGFAVANMTVELG